FSATSICRTQEMHCWSGLLAVRRHLGDFQREHRWTTSRACPTGGSLPQRSWIVRCGRVRGRQSELDRQLLAFESSWGVRGPSVGERPAGVLHRRPTRRPVSTGSWCAHAIFSSFHFIDRGAVPSLATAAASSADIQASVKFAAQHNLLLVVKNTG